MQSNPEIELAKQYIESTNLSLFLTGKAGTGKTTFLHHIVSTINKRYVVVAPTGVAAVNAGGVTIHSFFQLPFCPYLPDVKELVTEYQMPESKRQLRKEKLRIIRTLDLLIIDEISMVRADLLDAIDDALRRFRRSSKPFGGVQLLMIGDVQQLPPVVTDSEKPFMDRVYPSPFFFHSKALKKTPYVTIELKTIYRQQDERFVRLLNNIRDNRFDTDTLKQLNSRCVPIPEGDHHHAIRLTTHNHQADSINQLRMAQLPGKAHTFKASIDGNFPSSSAPTEEILVLKEGAQIMFVKNDTSGDHRYFNGKIGIIESISENDQGTLIRVVDEDGERISVNKEQWENIKYEIDPKDNQIRQKVDGTFEQYPLRLAWAITIHKAQGLTFDHVIVDAGQAFAYGQVYVALSRCRSLEGLILSTPITSAAAFNNSDVIGFVSAFTPTQEAARQLGIQKLKYHYDMLYEFFDLSPIERFANRISRTYHESLRNAYPEQTQKMSTLCLNELPNILSVAEKFRQQLYRLSLAPDNSSDSSLIPNQDYLNERVTKACAYFLEQLTGFYATITPLLQVEINNAEVEKSIKEDRESLAEAIGLKQACMKRVVKDKCFNVSSYLQTKTNCLLEKDNPKRKSEKKDKIDYQAIYSDNRHPKLIPMLSQWRRETYEELGVPAFVVLSQKTLVAIADRLPLSEEELLRIPGIGKAKVKQFGQEIIRVVKIYCADNGINISSDQTEIPNG